MSFAVDLSNFARKAYTSVQRARRGFLIKLFNSIIQDTPVDTGRLINNWQTSINSPIRSSILVNDQSGAAARRRMRSNLGRDDDDVWFVNNLPYAVAIEEGHSKDAPAGMMRKNVLRMEALVREAVFETRR